MTERRKPEHQAEVQRGAAATAVVEREPQGREVETLQLQRVAATLRAGAPPPRSGPALLAIQRHSGNRAMATALATRPAKATAVQRDFFAPDVYANANTRGKKAANIAAHLGEGVVNSVLAPINPRWWLKAYTDIAEIKTTDYGDAGSRVAKLFVGLAGTSQVLQKVATIAGIVSLLASITGAVTGGAAVAVGAIAGFVAMLASSLAAAIQLILLLRNVGSLNDTDRKKKFFADLASFIASTLGAVAGGLGANFGESGMGIAGGAGAVTDKFIAGSEMGKTFAGAGFGQLFGTVGDSVSEGLVQTKLEDGAVQRVVAPPKAEEGDTEQAGALAALMSASGKEAAAAGAGVKRGMDKQHDASKLIELLAGPGKGPEVPGAKGSALPAGSAASELPAKVGELGKTDAAAVGKGVEKERDPAKLDAIETKVEQVEKAVDAEPGEKKKPGMFRRFGAWLADKAMGLKGRLARAMAKAKATLMGFAAKLFGVSDDFKALTQDAPLAHAEGAAQVELATETGQEASKAAALLAKAQSSK